MKTTALAPYAFKDLIIYIFLYYNLKFLINITLLKLIIYN
jgi:hypothetical protein